MLYANCVLQVSSLYANTIRDGLGGMDSLRFVSLGWDDAAAAEFGRTLAEVPCRHVLKLDLGNNHEVSTLPESIGSLVALRSLTVPENITSLPESIGRLPKLEELDLSWCRLNALPASVAGMTSLRKLILSHSSVASLPSDLGSCEALQELHIDECQVTALPDSLAYLPGLRVIGVHSLLNRRKLEM